MRLTLHLPLSISAYSLRGHHAKGLRKEAGEAVDAALERARGEEGGGRGVGGGDQCSLCQSGIASQVGGRKECQRRPGALAGGMLSPEDQRVSGAPDGGRGRERCRCHWSCRGSRGLDVLGCRGGGDGPGSHSGPAAADGRQGQVQEAAIEAQAEKVCDAYFATRWRI